MRDVELGAPEARRVHDVERQGAQRPEDAADGVVGGLAGGVPEPSVQRARLDDVEHVPWCAERDTDTAREDARASAIPWHEGE